MKHYNPTEEQNQAAQERRERFTNLVKQIADLTAEQRAQLSSKMLVTTCEGRTLSFTNQMLVALQHDGATVVGGFQQWRRMGRAVSKGQHGISIWIPREPKKHEDKQPGEVSSKELEIRFFMGTVFDISQTQEIEH